MGFAFSVVAGRLVQLQGLEGAKYRAEAETQRLQQISIPAERGTITSADGAVLAMTVQTDTVTADPPQIAVPGKPQATHALREKVASALAGPLRMPAAAIARLLERPPSPDYALLASGVPGSAGDKITSLMKAMNVVGIYLTPTYTRVYPAGSLASNVVGFTDLVTRARRLDGLSSTTTDLVGEAGIEQSFNRRLAGRDGAEEVETGTGASSGHPIPVAANQISPMVPGGDVRLTILSSLQWKAQQACAAEVRTADADNCTVVVMEPQTGRILALAQSPGYDPAHVASLASTVDMPVDNVFDPGSTAKVITVAAAFEHGGQTPLSAYTVPDQITIDGFTYHDADPHPTERLTIAGILAHSSNVGMVQVVGHISPQIEYQYLRKFGLGSPTGLPLPDESAGILPPPSQWGNVVRHTLSYGQGVGATAVQMASVYATIANGGVRVQPTLVAGVTGPDGRFHPAPPPKRQRVIKASTAHELIQILQQVPYLDATLAAQPWGEIPGYSVASKTGTSQEGPCQCIYGSSYIGMAPASAPKLVVAVNVQNPRKGSYYGNAVAGPVFYQVMRFALQALKIPPDGAKRPIVPLTAP